jgi:hypothetical protein
MNNAQDNQVVVPQVEPADAAVRVHILKDFKGNNDCV